MSEEEQELEMYIEEPEISESIKKFFIEYASIESTLLRDHLMNVRDRAWKKFNYPCLGRWAFLDFSIQRNPIYEEIVEKCKNEGATIIDFGCCLGQDVRKLIYDGVPIHQIRAYELDPFFIEQGYELFLDEDIMKKNEVFNCNNIFDDEFFLNVEPADYLHVASFIHLFDAEKQKDVCRRLTRLCKRAILGRQIGSSIPHQRRRYRRSSNEQMMCHSPQSFAQMWEEVTNGLWKVESATLQTRQQTQHSNELLTFVVRNTNQL